MHLRYFFGFAGILIAFAAAADEWGIDDLLSELSAVKELETTFVETKNVNFLEFDLVMNGNIKYQSPDLLIKETLSPKYELLKIQQDRITVNNKKGREKKSISIHARPTLSAAIEGVRATLAGDHQALDKFFMIGLDGERQQWVLTLIPNKTGLHRFIRKIELIGSENRIQTIRTLEMNGDISLLQLEQ